MTTGLWGLMVLKFTVNSNRNICSSKHLTFLYFSNKGVAGKNDIRSGSEWHWTWDFSWWVWGPGPAQSLSYSKRYALTKSEEKLHDAAQLQMLEKLADDEEWRTRTAGLRQPRSARTQVFTDDFHSTWSHVLSNPTYEILMSASVLFQLFFCLLNDLSFLQSMEDCIKCCSTARLSMAAFKISRKHHDFMESNSYDLWWSDNFMTSEAVRQDEMRVLFVRLFVTQPLHNKVTLTENDILLYC